MAKMTETTGRITRWLTNEDLPHFLTDRGEDIRIGWPKYPGIEAPLEDAFKAGQHLRLYGDGVSERGRLRALNVEAWQVLDAPEEQA